jgi:hypothetical protein
MNLEQATAAALIAAQKGDLNALAGALEARGAALEGGEEPTPGVLAAGELTANLLREMMRDIAAESAQLRRFASAVGAGSEDVAPHHFEYEG